MSLIDSLSLFVAIFVLAITPGPGLFAVISKSLNSGFKNASFVVFGLVLGDIIYFLIAVFGLNTIANLLGNNFIYIKYLGGIYLFYIGYKILTAQVEDINLDKNIELSKIKNFITGLAITLSNPKVIIFYLGFLPAFINLQILNIYDIIISLTIVSLTLLVVVLTYSYLANKTRDMFKNKKSIKRLNTISSFIMFGVAILIILR